MLSRFSTRWSGFPPCTDFHSVFGRAVQASGGDIGAGAGARAPILPQLRPFAPPALKGQALPPPPPFATATRRSAALPGTLGLMRAYFLVKGCACHRLTVRELDARHSPPHRHQAPPPPPRRARGYYRARPGLRPHAGALHPRSGSRTDAENLALPRDRP